MEMVNLLTSWDPTKYAVLFIYLALIFNEIYKPVSKF